MPDYDALIIGAGHNGLTAAAYLARAGLRVLVLERRSSIGGAAGTEEVFPGFKVNTGAFDAGLFLPEIVAELALESHGLHFIQSPAVMCALQPDGSELTLWRDKERSAAEIARFSEADAGKFPAYLERVSRLAGILRLMEMQAPPNLPKSSLRDLLPWLRVGIKVKRLGNRDMMEFLRTLPLPASDFLDEWFESPALKAALGSEGVMGAMVGSKSAGTSLLMLYQAAGSNDGLPASRFVRGGLGALSHALANAAIQYKAEIRTGASVAGILVEKGQAGGVVLENGEKITARIVLSSTNPRYTYFDLVGAPHLEVRLVREVKNIRLRSSLARINLALSGLPRFNAIRPDDHERLSAHLKICPSLDYLEHAYDETKYGRFSSQPYLNMVIPTLLDPGLAPQGRHLLSINVHYTPYKLAGGTWEEQREPFGDQVIRLLEAYAPGIKEMVLHRQVLTPVDLECEYGLTSGDIFHGQMSLDQLLFMRPVPGYPAYHTAIQNLYLCGAGSHPGGGVTGAPGCNAAREALKFL
jgi:phytoene dehydrogenase-like protein